MKICMISPFKAADPTASFDLRKKTYSLCKSDTVVEHRQIGKASNDIDDLTYSYMWSRAKSEMVEAIIEAEKDGYDAAIVDCFLDIGVQEARSMVDIPVLGPGETTMMYATLLGSKFGISTGPVPFVVETLTRQIRERGLESRAISNRPVRPHPVTRQEMVAAMQQRNAQVLANGVEKVGRELIKDGAEVVICGVTTMGPSCTMAGLVKIEPEGVPVLDCIAITVKMTEIMVDFKDQVGLPSVNRKQPMYQIPSQDDRKRLRRVFGTEAG